MSDTIIALTALMAALTALLTSFTALYVAIVGHEDKEQMRLDNEDKLADNKKQ